MLHSASSSFHRQYKNLKKFFYIALREGSPDVSWMDDAESNESEKENLYQPWSKDFGENEAEEAVWAEGGRLRCGQQIDERKLDVGHTALLHDGPQRYVMTGLCRVPPSLYTLVVHLIVAD